jgi:hypothetical protein
VTAWREEDHPRDDRGRWILKGLTAAVSMRRTLGDLAGSSDDDLLDVFLRLSSRGRPSLADLRRLHRVDVELARRGGSDPLTSDPDEERREQRYGRQIDKLVSKGMSYSDAFNKAYAIPDRDDEDQAVPVERRRGERTEQALRREYQELTYMHLLQAESACRGHLLNKAAEMENARRSRTGKAAISPAELFSARSDRARKWASEDLKRWWEANGGRQTYADYKATRSGTAAGRRRVRASAAAGNGRDFGV